MRENYQDDEVARVIDRTIIMMALMITETLLFKSRWPEEIRTGVAMRIQGMLEKMGVKAE
jgi:hypothetical protein